MKALNTLLKNIMLLAVLAAGSASCSQEEYPKPNQELIPVAAEYESDIMVEVDQETNYVYFSFNGKGVMPVWIIDGQYSTSMSLSRYYRKAGDYSVEVKIANANGISDGSVIKEFHIDKTKMNGFGGFVYDSEYNMWKNGTIQNPAFYYAPGWSQIADPSWSVEGTGYKVPLPSATTDQWQAQMLISTDMSSTSESTYDFSVILTSNTDHPGVTVKLTQDGDDGNFFFEEKVSLVAGEPKCFWKSDMPGIDAPSLKMVFDFGGNADNTEITVEDIVFKNHADDDGTVIPEEPQEPEVPEPDWVAVDSPENLWNGAEYEISQYYAPGWSPLPNPEVKVEGYSFSMTFPSATFEQWQNQFTLISGNVSATAASAYDFRVEFTSNADIPKATVKIAQSDNDDVFIFTETVSILANETTVFKAVNKAGADITSAKIVFDFGGNPDNTNIVISNIILQEHKN